MPAVRENILTAATNQSRKSGGFYGWHNVGLLFMIQFAASGFVYFAYSAVFPVMIETTGWNRGTASLAQTMALLLLGLCYPLTGYLLGRYGARKTMTVGLTVMLSGLLLLATVVDQLWQWILVWGVVIGLSQSLTGPIVSQTAMISWFKARRAFSIGIVMTGAALGGAIAQPSLSALMAYFDSWRAAWLFAAAMIFLAIIITQYIINRPADIDQFPDNIDPALNMESGDAATKTIGTDQHWTMKEVAGQLALYLLLLVTIAYFMTFFFFLNHGALHLIDHGRSGIEAASIIGLAILGSGIARIPAGWLGDKFDLRWTVFGSILCMTIAIFGFWRGESFILLSASAMLLGAGYGSMLVLGPVVTGNYFGERAFPVINSVMAPIMLPFAAIAPVGGGYIFETTGSYDLAFIIALILLLAALVAAFFMQPPQKAPVPSHV